MVIPSNRAKLPTRESNMKRQAKKGRKTGPDDIAYSSTGKTPAAIRTGAVSSLEVLAAHLKQIETHNGALNAVVIMDVDRALKRAREADAALARGEIWGPLHGVPHTLKDCHATA